MHTSPSIDECFGDSPGGLTGVFATLHRARRPQLASRNRRLTSASCAGKLAGPVRRFIATWALLRRHEPAAVFSEK